MGTRLWQVLIAASIIAGAWFLSWLMAQLFRKIVAGCTLEEARKAQLFHAFGPPLRFLIMLAGIWFTTQVVALPLWLEPIASRTVRTMVLFGLFAGLYRGAELISEAINGALNKEVHHAELILPMLRKILKGMIVVLGAITILEDWGYDVAGILAGLGLGGLALALAAKDTAANFFGGVALMLEHPFAIGDWVATGDIEGIVEEIGIRSTKVRTFAQAQVTVPNSLLAGSVITNWSRMGKRRYAFKLFFPFDTPHEKIDIFQEKVLAMLKGHPGVHPDAIYVNFNGFSQSGLEINILSFAKSIMWAEYQQVVHEVNQNILAIVEELDLKLAYPTRTLEFPKQASAKESEIKI